MVGEREKSAVEYSTVYDGCRRMRKYYESCKSNRYEIGIYREEKKKLNGKK